MNVLVRLFDWSTWILILGGAVVAVISLGLLLVSQGDCEVVNPVGVSAEQVADRLEALSEGAVLHGEGGAMWLRTPGGWVSPVGGGRVGSYFVASSIVRAVAEDADKRVVFVCRRDFV